MSLSNNSNNNNDKRPLHSVSQSQGCNHFQLWCEAQKILVSSEFALLSVHINKAASDGCRGHKNPQPINRDEKMNQKTMALGTHWLSSLYVPGTSFQTSNTVLAGTVLMTHEQVSLLLADSLLICQVLSQQVPMHACAGHSLVAGMLCCRRSNRPEVVLCVCSVQALGHTHVHID